MNMYHAGQLLFIMSGERIMVSTFALILLLAIIYNFNPFLTSGLVHLYQFYESISSFSDSGGCLHLYYILSGNL